ncbi:hypothetical protein VB319_19570 [Vibrio parahaemolyticus]|uniref:hypothetical protein n=1 Tax=Vibrio TaxID=662 RepID=UPI000A20778B|nr:MULTISPECIES: hypothetical protein [Vibrio]ARN69456.1 hypothetical protein FORC36_4939 [Vibrio vulnificus]MCF9167897.1 hypothetical protein [Vibrio parahaemolyticus]MEA5356172.1 hypothetical protein [Vibrio parahaemolyticus]
MSTYYPVRAFTEKRLIEVVNQELATTRLRVRVTSIVKSDGFKCVFKTNTKKHLMVQFAPFNSWVRIQVRAIHRIRDSFKPYTYMFNGQGGKNLETLMCNGEEGQAYQLSEDEVRKYFSETLPQPANHEKVELNVKRAFGKAA